MLKVCLYLDWAIRWLTVDGTDDGRQGEEVAGVTMWTP